MDPELETTSSTTSADGFISQRHRSEQSHSRHTIKCFKHSRKGLLQKRHMFRTSHLYGYYLIAYLALSIILSQASPSPPTFEAISQPTNDSSDVIGRSAQLQNAATPQLQALLTDLWHWRTQDSPQFATMVGLNDNTAGRLDSFTKEHFQDRKVQCESFLKRAEELDSDALSFDDRVSLRVMQHHLLTYVANYQDIRLYAPVTLLEGPHLSFPRLVGEQMTLDSYDDFQKLLSRYGMFPRQVIGMRERMQEAVEEGTVPPALAMDGILQQLSSFAVSVTSSQFFAPFVDLPESITTLQRQTLRQQAQERLAQDVLPAYHDLHQFMQTTYLPASRAVASLSSVEGGSAVYEAALRYHTDTSLTPHQIHDLGKSEMDRMHPLIRQAAVAANVPLTNTTSSVEHLMSAIRDTPGRYYTNAHEMVAALEVAVAAAGPGADDFGATTEAELRVRGSSVGSLPSRVMYEGASLHGGRPATVTLDTSDITLLSRDSVTSIALSVGVPGRHLLEEHLRTTTGVPTFRRVLRDVRYNDAPAKLSMYSSFVEGWSLYAQYLGEKRGTYVTPQQKLGRLCGEMEHAAFMVADSGLHQMAWTLDHTTQFLLDNTPLTPIAVKKELRRIVTWPGLASAAKVGEIKIKELRQKSYNALGELFRLQDFHSVVLKCAGPISLLQTCVDHYIASVTQADASARAEQTTPTDGGDASLAPENVPPDHHSEAATLARCSGSVLLLAVVCLLLLI